MTAARRGALGIASAFSFHGSKTVTTGEGGMLASDDARLIERVRFLRDHGRSPGDRQFQNTEIAWKYKMSAVQAALGIAQMERIDALIEQKRRIFGWYSDRLGARNDLALNAEPAGVTNSYWMVTMVPEAGLGLDKFDLQEAFRSRNVDTRPFFSPLSTLPAFAGRPEARRFTGPGDRGRAVARSGLNLPSGYTITEELVDLVCGVVDEVMTDPPRAAAG